MILPAGGLRRRCRRSPQTEHVIRFCRKREPMRRALAVPFLLAILGFGVPGAAAADTVLAGDDGQAFYKIVVPDGWNGDLVVWNHGFSLSPVVPVSDLGPLAPL